MAGIPQWVNAAVIDCTKPTPKVIEVGGRPGMVRSASKPAPFVIATGGRPGLTLETRKPAPYEINVRPTLTTRR